MNRPEEYRNSISAVETARPEPAARIIDQGTILDFGAWTLDEDGLLTVSGRKKMPDWDYNPETKRAATPLGGSSGGDQANPDCQGRDRHRG